MKSFRLLSFHVLSKLIDASFVPLPQSILAQRNHDFLRIPSKARKMAANPDSFEAIQEALRMSKEYGKDSEEAKVAWDIVEEIDASSNIR